MKDAFQVLVFIENATPQDTKEPQFGTIPMLLQDAPAAFNRIVFAVIGRVVQQLDGFAGVIGEVHHAFEELSSHPTAFRPINR